MSFCVLQITRESYSPEIMVKLFPDEKTAREYVLNHLSHYIRSY